MFLSIDNEQFNRVNFVLIVLNKKKLILLFGQDDGDGFVKLQRNDKLFL